MNMRVIERVLAVLAVLALVAIALLQQWGDDWSGMRVEGERVPCMHGYGSSFTHR